MLQLEYEIRAALKIDYDTLARIFGTQLAVDECQLAADQAATAMCWRLSQAVAESGWSGLFATRPAIDYGLRSLLSSAHLRALAAVGLCNSFTSRRSEIEALVGQAGYDVGGLLEGADALAARTGVKLLECDDDRLVAAV